MSNLVEVIGEHKYYDGNSVMNLFNYCARYEETTGAYNVEWAGSGIVESSGQAVIDSMHFVKKAYCQEGGKQCYHLVINVFKKGSTNNYESCLGFLSDEVSYLIYNEGYQNCYFIHTDSDILHAHFIINSVNYVTKHKLTQMNALKNKIFTYLKKNYEFLKWEDIYYSEHEW